MSELFDPGLQPERTELAWRRTSLGIGVGSLIALRLLPAALGDAWWVIVGVAGLVVASAVWMLASRRARAVHRVLLRDGDRAPLPGAIAIAALAAFSLCVGLLALVAVWLAVTR